ncbi:MAG: DCC1-like thiol-disulfide oxidoreductase family protein [Nitrospinota bacterium]|nr:DCC1-like thiol-disulfide oxidoreductase family protein [Nitrospinota bacterium]MDP7167643.1 DCC1-like thiol-disulfide oxidoreductase family protein [Nitrospinota bacterium]MDP7370667.1 DCC1-like thiol-disulfide oxidoreductase family protein [Nitrospinota bacterium]MDP7504762.1 DCC1-like thiol-disulfide oxidoreductase family protein [Nitrospinota bacterium]MDP7664654.1 DCC1-like thiol-disulfide oxidoreductase family protein [Nitrospinota bacterium]
MNAPVPKAVLLWDGDCALCRSCAGWLERQDRAGALLALPFQQIPSPPMTPALGARCRRAIQFIPPDGRALSSGRAVLGVLSLLGWKKSAAFLSAAPFVFIVEGGYWLIARNRGLIGRLLTGNSGNHR